jgi:S1-C subfamily serine protease
MLVTVNGRWTTSVTDVYHAAVEVKPGQRTTVVIQRAGREMTLTVTPVDGA